MLESLTPISCLIEKEFRLPYLSIWLIGKSNLSTRCLVRVNSLVVWLSKTSQKITKKSISLHNIEPQSHSCHSTATLPNCDDVIGIIDGYLITTLWYPSQKPIGQSRGWIKLPFRVIYALFECSHVINCRDMRLRGEIFFNTDQSTMFAVIWDKANIWGKHLNWQVNVGLCIAHSLLIHEDYKVTLPI